MMRKPKAANSGAALARRRSVSSHLVTPEARRRSARVLIQAAEQMEQQRPAGLAEGQISELVHLRDA
jgi:hypothetical protein